MNEKCPHLYPPRPVHSNLINEQWPSTPSMISLILPSSILPFSNAVCCRTLSIEPLLRLFIIPYTLHLLPDPVRAQDLPCLTHFLWIKVVKPHLRSVVLEFLFLLRILPLMSSGMANFEVDLRVSPWLKAGGLEGCHGCR